MNINKKIKDAFLDESPSEPLYLALKNIKKAQTAENIAVFEKIFKNVGLSMILDGERRKHIPRREPAERTHGTGVGTTLVCS